ncbi:SGNH/GDSL hydrolase family protein [Mycobacterium sp. M23085]|uniref:SGNH/GDSL hydrolase family protein n=1 Tax=Mycobacterium sp. M23085 TaxID=3378087 RepID=UPI0038781D5E
MTGPPRPETVACLGSSTTASRGTYKWIDELQRRPSNSRFRFVNFGVGGDLSANAVRRLDRVIARRPDRVIVLIGSNDIMASVFPNFRRFVRVAKRFHDEPTPERFDENLGLMVRRLQRDAHARVALSSLAPVGEEPGSRHPVQARLNDLFSTYNGIIRAAAARESTDYIPFYEAFQECLTRAATTKSFTRFCFASLYRDYLWREMIMRQSFDEISRRNGWEFHIDGIHLKTNGGRILTEAVQRFLDS